MFISVGNSINLVCHVKGNGRLAVARLDGELGYPEAACCARKSEGGLLPGFQVSIKLKSNQNDFWFHARLRYILEITTLPKPVIIHHKNHPIWNQRSLTSFINIRRSKSVWHASHIRIRWCSESRELKKCHATVCWGGLIAVTITLSEKMGLYIYQLTYLPEECSHQIVFMEGSIWRVLSLVIIGTLRYLLYHKEIF